MRTKKEFYGDPDRRPVAPRVNPAGIPDELKAIRNWVLWQFVWDLRREKWDKPPYQPNGDKAKSNDPATWSSFDDAMNAYLAGGYDGVGFELLDSGMVGIDLDSCRDPDSGGILFPWVTDLIARANTFTDISPSDLGFKLIGRGVWPDERRNKWPHPDGGEVEIYTTQYFTVTGRRQGVNGAR